MSLTKTNDNYRTFGLVVSSEVPLNGLTKIEGPINTIDVEIKIQNLSDLWFELSDQYNAFVISEDLVMFQVPNTAIFSIQNGKTIIVSPLVGYDEDLANLYLLGTCMGAILMQRKIYPLHGSAIAIKGKAYAIVGESGAGKSTLASAFINEGYHLLTDDVIAITLSKDKSKPFVIPSYPQQKLWKDSLSNLDIDSSELRPIYRMQTKYNVPVSSKFLSEPLPLAGVFELIKSKSEHVEYRIVEKLERFFTLYSNTFRNSLIRGLGLMEWHFQTTANILDKTDIYKINRPLDGFSTPRLVSLILKTIKENEHD